MKRSIGFGISIFLTATFCVSVCAGTMRVRVTDEKDQPVMSAKIHTESNAGPTTLPIDRDGAAQIQFGTEKNDWLRITAKAPGYMNASAQWWWPPKKPELVPAASITLALRPGIKVGGFLKNENGQPIADARVNLNFKNPETQKPDYVAGDIFHTLWDHNVRTDAQGHWSTDMAPPTWTEAYTQPSHPDYYSPESLTDMKDEKALRDGTAVTVMTRGRTLSGHVRGPDGRPVAGAIVQAAKVIADRSPRVTTDAEGAFLIPHAAPDHVKLLVRAPSLAPLLKTVADTEGKDLELRLERPRMVRGKVVDEAGHPVEEAFVMLMGWERMDQMFLKEWQRHTDAQGRFDYDQLPNVTMYAVVSKDGYGIQRGVQFRPETPEPTITLRKPARVSGRVIDAATGQVIPKFRVLGATTDQDISSQWFSDSRSGGKGINGDYEFLFPNAYQTYRVRIEADGYMPVSSEILQPVNGKCVFDAKLKAAANLSGIVVGPDRVRKPVAGAKVFVLTKFGGTLRLDSTLNDTGRGSFKPAITAADGSFSIPSPGDPYDFFIVHKTGYVRVPHDTYEKSPGVPMTVTPWSSIEGIVKSAQAAAIPCEVVVRTPLRPRSPDSSVEFDLRAKVDPATGKYVIDRLPAGKFSVRRVSGAPAASSPADTKPVTIEAGQTITVDF
jgi:hypothetical protein